MKLVLLKVLNKDHEYLPKTGETDNWDRYGDYGPTMDVKVLGVLQEIPQSEANKIIREYESIWGVVQKGAA